MPSKQCPFHTSTALAQSVYAQPVLNPCTHNCRQACVRSSWHNACVHNSCPNHACKAPAHSTPAQPMFKLSNYYYLCKVPAPSIQPSGEEVKYNLFLICMPTCAASCPMLACTDSQSYLHSSCPIYACAATIAQTVCAQHFPDPRAQKSRQLHVA